MSDLIDSHKIDEQPQLDAQIAKGKKLGALGMLLGIFTILFNLVALFSILDGDGDYIAILPGVTGVSSLMISIIARSISSKAGVGNGMAIAGTILGMFSSGHAIALIYIAFK